MATQDEIHTATLIRLNAATIALGALLRAVNQQADLLRDMRDGCSYDDTIDERREVAAAAQMADAARECALSANATLPPELLAQVAAAMRLSPDFVTRALAAGH